MPQINEILRRHVCSRLVVDGDVGNMSVIQIPADQQERGGPRALRIEQSGYLDVERVCIDLQNPGGSGSIERYGRPPLVTAIQP